MKNLGPLRKQEGSLLIACALIVLIIIAAMVQFTYWTRQFTHANVHRLATQKALMNADSGIQAALSFLRTPQSAQLKPGVGFLQSSLDAGTTFYITMTRRASDTSLVDVFTTGYFQLNEGSFVNAGINSQKAVLYALIQLRDVGDYFAASPASLEISYGSDISSGVVYAKDLTFDQGSTNPKTVVKSAYYYNSINPLNYNRYVRFMDPTSPTRLSTPPTLPTLDASMRNDYINMAVGGTLLPNATLDGPVAPPPNSYSVYFSAGDIYLGSTASSCTITGSMLIYSQRDIHIVNSIIPATNSTAWPALLAEGNIYIDPAAPDVLNINATMVTNGQFQAQGPARPNGTLSITGGIVVGAGASLGNVYVNNRTYRYQAPDPNLPLPFVTNVINYKIISGKYNQ